MTTWKEILQLYLSGIAKWKSEKEFRVDKETTIEIVDIDKKMWVERKWYNNGQKRYETNWINGCRHRISIGWYKNGQKWREINWKDGKQHGVENWWYPSGQKWCELIYENGKLISRKHFDKKGKPI